MRRQAKADNNQPEIVRAFRELGCSVQHLHAVGQGCPDILIGKYGLNLLVEIKDGKNMPSKKRLTQDEADWHRQWRGQVCIVESTKQAVALITKLARDPNERPL